MATRSRSDDENAQLDLTPMLDVVFILLIFFVVFASFLKEHALPLQNSAPKISEAGGQSLVLRVTEQNEVFHGQRKVEPQSVRSYIARMQAELGGTLSVVVAAHPSANVSSYVSIANSARLAAIATVAITLEGSPAQQ